MPDFPPPQHLIEAVLAGAGRCDQRIVVVEETHEVEVRFANNAPTTNGSRRARRVTVVALHELEGGGVGVGIARRSGDVDGPELIRDAERSALAAPPADDVAPLLSPGEAGPAGPAGTLARRFDAPPRGTDLSVLADVLAGLGDVFHRAQASGLVLAGFAEHRQITSYVGTSTGVRLAHAQPEGALQIVARDADGTASSWVGTATPDFGDVSVDAIEARLRERLAWSANRIDRDPGRYQVILPPAAVADLMVSIAFEASGQSAEDGRSAFSRPDGGTRKGERIGPMPFNLRSDPAAPGLESTPFAIATASTADTSVFDNGLAVTPTDWIASGHINRLRYHRAGAARSGEEPATVPGNLMLDVPGATATLEEMIAQTEHGLLLTCLWYLREVDPTTMLLTGLTRDGVYAIEDGTVVGMVNNFRFNESPLDLLGRVTEAGASERTLGREFGEYFNRTRMPPLRIPDFNMSSVSRAT